MLNLITCRVRGIESCNDILLKHIKTNINTYIITGVDHYLYCRIKTHKMVVSLSNSYHHNLYNNMYYIYLDYKIKETHSSMTVRASMMAAKRLNITHINNYTQWNTKNHWVNTHPKSAFNSLNHQNNITKYI